VEEAEVEGRFVVEVLVAEGPLEVAEVVVLLVAVLLVAGLLVAGLLVAGLLVA
jgi:hypothetical protein